MSSEDVRSFRLLDRTAPLLILFLLVGSVLLIAAFKTVHHRQPSEITSNGNATRTQIVITRWMKDGYFHFAGLRVHHPTENLLYRSWTGFSMVSLLVAEKIYAAASGHYSWRLAAIHNQLVSLLLAALAASLAFRISRRIGLDVRLAFACGCAVVIVLFTFPSNLATYWELSAQLYWAVFAVVFLLIEERCLDGRRTRALSLAQAGAMFLMTMMEGLAAVAFLAAFAITVYIFEPNRTSWRRFALLCLIPLLAAFAIFTGQRKIAAARFPETAFVGSDLMFRSGLDGESRYYGNHLGIAYSRDVARLNWPANGRYLFRWPTVFVLGILSSLLIAVGLITERVPRFAFQTLAVLIGTWVLYAAVFSQAFVIHPYLFDVILFVPMAIAVFALGPALLESLTRRTGTIVLIVVFCACWYAMFQMRLYALEYPMPGTQAAAAPAP